MAENRLFTADEQVALVDNAQSRMDSVARGWLDNAKVKAALLREHVEDCETKKAS